MKKRDRRQEDQGGVQWLNAMCEVLKGGVLAGVTAILSLLACAVLVSLGVLPVGGMKGAVLAVCVLGSLVGGAYGVKKVGTLPLLGPGVGLVLFLLLLTAGLLVYDGASVEQGGAGILLACLCGGAIPGLLGRRPKKKRRR